MVNQKLSYSPEIFPSDASLQMKYSDIHNCRNVTVPWLHVYIMDTF